MGGHAPLLRRFEGLPLRVLSHDVAETMRAHRLGTASI
jgi:hypothetical protein